MRAPLCTGCCRGYSCFEWESAESCRGRRFAGKDGIIMNDVTGASAASAGEPPDDNAREEPSAPFTSPLNSAFEQVSANITRYEGSTDSPEAIEASRNDVPA